MPVNLLKWLGAKLLQKGQYHSVGQLAQDTGMPSVMEENGYGSVGSFHSFHTAFAPADFVPQSGAQTPVESHPPVSQPPRMRANSLPARPQRKDVEFHQYMGAQMPSLLYMAQPGTLKVERPVLNQVDFDDRHAPNTKRKLSARDRVASFGRSQCKCSGERLKRFFLNRLPFIGIMKNYKVREWLLGDIVAGLTVGIMHLPQGMAYALLASMPPIVGLYVSFFPVLLYFFFGTSRHISVGTFAVICLMVGAAVEKQMADWTPSNVAAVSSVNNFTSNVTQSPLEDGKSEYEDHPEYIKAKIQMAVALTLLVGIWQLLMGILRMGFLTIYLSDPLIKGFTTGAACHVLTTQVKYIFGLKIPRFSEPFKIIKTYVAIFKNIADTNVAEVIIAVICILFLVIIKECINNRFKAKMKMPVPVELIVVVAGTMVSYFGKLPEQFNVLNVGDIPTGIPAPSVPPGEHLSAMISDAFAIAIVAFTVSVSMSKLLAKNHNYEINPNQELIAFGIVNTVSSFFNTFVSCASLSRSLVQETVGGHTQVAGLISSGLILIVLLWLGPLFTSLPNSCLAAIILVALKGMFLQFADLKRLWSISRYDFAIWIITFLSVFLLGVDLGLLVGVAFSLLTVVFRTQRPYTCLYGRVPHTDIYRDMNNYQVCQEVPGIKIFHFEASLYYANAEHFRNRIYALTGANPVTLCRARQKIEDKQNKLTAKRQAEEKKRRNKEIKNGGVYNTLDAEAQVDAPSPISVVSTNTTDNALSFDIHHIIIDCATMGFIDSVGVKVLSQVINEYKDVDVTIFLAHCKGYVRNMFNKAGFYDQHDRAIIYLSIHDAVIAALREHHDLSHELEIERDTYTRTSSHVLSDRDTYTRTSSLSDTTHGQLPTSSTGNLQYQGTELDHISEKSSACSTSDRSSSIGDDDEDEPEKKNTKIMYIDEDEVNTSSDKTYL